MPGTTLLVDGPSMIWRAYYAVPDTVRAPDGTPVAGAYGFLSMLARLVEDIRPNALACCLDADWRPEWRVDLVPEYKAQRVAIMEEDAATEVDAQTDIVRRILALARVAVVEAAECEAEDVIATLVRRIRGRIAIVSGDRDLFQLVRDPNVWVLYPRRGVSDLVRFDEAEIRRRYGIPGRTYADFAVLRGDPSDGLPGVRGVGEKTAALLIDKHGSLEAVLGASAGATSGPLAKVAAGADYVRRAAEVVRMKGDCAIGDPDLSLGRAPSPKLKPLAKGLGLAGAVDRLLAAIAASAAKKR